MTFFFKTEKWLEYSKHSFVVLFCVLFALGFFYVYFMNLAVVKTAQGNANMVKLADIRGQFQGLESSYIVKLNQLNISYAKSLGFVESDPETYIHQPRAVVQNDNYGRNF